MAGIREQKKAETRQAITVAAVALFSTKGYEKTSIEDIARAAKIGKATIYTYFSTKDEIFMSYCDDELEDSFAQFRTPQFVEGQLIDHLLKFFMIKFRFVTKNHEFGRQLLREMVFPKTINEKVKEHDKRYFDILENIFRSAQKRGELAGQLDMFHTTVHFYSLYLGALAGWYTGYVDSVEEVEAALRILFSQAIEGVGV
ncbi:MAG TPA: TetR/AcrR family transcriptional regulator [Malonomonas sp.]